MLRPLVTKSSQWDYISTKIRKECECEGISVRTIKEIEEWKENFEIGNIEL